jgi:hypothetical protein
MRKIDVLEKLAQGWTMEGFEALEAIAIEAKQPLSAMLGFEGKHVFSFDYIDTDSIYYWLKRHGITENNMSYIQQNVCSEAVIMSAVNSVFMSDENLVSIEALKLNEEGSFTKLIKRFSKGKLTKFLSHVFKPEISQQFTHVWSNARSKRQITLSLEAIDFLRMSHGNSWSSCHDTRVSKEDKYSYMNGCSGLAACPNTLIAYEQNSKDETLLNWRVNVIFNRDGIAFSRQYPNSVNGLCEAIVAELKRVSGIPYGI